MSVCDSQADKVRLFSVTGGEFFLKSHKSLGAVLVGQKKKIVAPPAGFLVAFSKRHRGSDVISMHLLRTITGK